MVTAPDSNQKAFCSYVSRGINNTISKFHCSTLKLKIPNLSLCINVRSSPIRRHGGVGGQFKLRYIRIYLYIHVIFVLL
jgi:hypothetical protein